MVLAADSNHWRDYCLSEVWRVEAETVNETLHFIVLSTWIVMLGGILYGAYRVINSASNELDWTHLIGTERDGKTYCDWNKIGMGAGVVLSIWMPAAWAYNPKADANGIALVMGVSLAFLGGVSSYAATLRARRGTTTTTDVDGTKRTETP